ncbi:MAG TPA: T9SS type A sorting domain-containing protein, partial [Prolixibacteraceae bacterium]|nr:T9SS type A sorting domain-containing protein [Prolixibacteraceae bacterium]
FIYPNPVKENLIVITNVTDFPLTLELTDMRGVKIMSVIIDSEKSDISLKRLNKGIYLYKLSSKSRIIKSSKLLKI